MVFHSVKCSSRFIIIWGVDPSQRRNNSEGGHCISQVVCIGLIEVIPESVPLWAAGAGLLTHPPPLLSSSYHSALWGQRGVQGLGAGAGGQPEHYIVMPQRNFLRPSHHLVLSRRGVQFLMKSFKVENGYQAWGICDGMAWALVQYFTSK